MKAFLLSIKRTVIRVVFKLICTERMATMDKKFVAVLMLSAAFMMVFTAFQTMGNIEKTILDSIKNEDDSFQGEAFYSLAIIYAVMSICNWAAPSIISVVGPRIAMIYGGITYLIFIASFLIPKTWLLYLVSVVIGTGAATIWTGQGNYLTLNSKPATISRNSGIFWAILQLSMFVGNIFVYFQFQGEENIEKSSREVVIWTLSAICVAGIVVMLFFPKAPTSQNDEEEGLAVEQPRGPLEALKGAFRLFTTKNMALLNITFFYTGLELGFWSGVYGPSLGFTKGFEKSLVGLSGVFIGLGEVIGGALFGIFSKKTNRWGRDPIIIGAFILHLISFFLVFLNIPNDAPFGESTSDAFITSNEYLAMFCSFLLGFGDACYNTQIFSMLGSAYADDSASAFAIFKFTQSVAAAASFFYANALGLYGQLGILLGLLICGSASFVWVEWQVKKEAKSINEDEKHN